MKALVLQLVTWVSVSTLSNAQKSMPHFLQNGLARAHQPLVVVDTFRTFTNCFIIDSKQISSIIVSKDSSVWARFGVGSNRSILFVETKPGLRFLRVEDIFRLYKVAADDAKLRVCIDQILIREPNFILIEASEILEVHITTQRHFMLFEDMNSGERYVNIVTRSKEKSASQIAL